MTETTHNTCPRCGEHYMNGYKDGQIKTLQLSEKIINCLEYALSEKTKQLVQERLKNKEGTP